MTKKAVIKGLLEDYPEYRYGDKKLWVHIAKEQCRQHNVTTMDEFWETYLNTDNIWGADMVRSTSCSLRKAHPELRPPLEDQIRNQEISEGHANEHRDIMDEGIGYYGPTNNNNDLGSILDEE